jgi:hypothetical protein
MTGCKQYRQQLALLSVRTLEGPEKAVVLAHVRECAGCRAYWEQLQGVARLFRDDAERSIEPQHAPVFVRSLRRPELFSWLTFPRAIACAVGMFALCAGMIFLRNNPQQPDIASSVASQRTPISVPTIADSRRLVNGGLDALMENPGQSRERGFVFSVGTRYEGQ